MRTTWGARAVAGLAVVAVVTLAGCTAQPRAVVRGGDDPSATASVDVGLEGGSTALVGGPLTAQDLPGWSDGPMPTDAAGSLISVCGTPLGTAEPQSQSQEAAVTTPVGIEVVTSVATYSPESLAKVVSAVDSVLGSCSMWDSEATSTTVATLRTSASGKATGAVLTSQDQGSSARTVTAFMLAVTGDGVVQVRARAHLDGTALTWPLQDFAAQVLSAAQRKALGGSVGIVRSPEIVATDSGDVAAVGQAPDDENSPTLQWGTSGAGTASSGGSGSTGSDSGAGVSGATGGTTSGGAPVQDQLPGESGIEPQVGAPPAEDVYGPLDGSAG